MANSVDPEKQSDQGLHCLHMLEKSEYEILGQLLYK